jgi:hypothetical protein
MSHTRIDEIYEALRNLHDNIKSFDGSRTMGFVTPEMKVEHEKLSKKILDLEAELESIKEVEHVKKIRST